MVFFYRCQGFSDFLDDFKIVFQADEQHIVFQKWVDAIATVLTITTARCDIFRSISTICFFAKNLQKRHFAIIMTCIHANCHALHHLLPPFRFVVQMTKRTQLFFLTETNNEFAWLIFCSSTSSGSTRTPTLYIGGRNPPADSRCFWFWDLRMHTATQDLRIWESENLRSENAHGNTRTGKKENDDAFRSSKSRSSRGNKRLCLFQKVNNTWDLEGLWI